MKPRVQATLGAQRSRNRSTHDGDEKVGVVRSEELRLLQSSTKSSLTNGQQGSLVTPSARIKVDEKLFGNDRVDCSEDFSKRLALLARSSGMPAAPNFVELVVEPMPKDRGAEQGDADGP